MTNPLRWVLSRLRSLLPAVPVLRVRPARAMPVFSMPPALPALLGSLVLAGCAATSGPDGNGYGMREGEAGVAHLPSLPPPPVPVDPTATAAAVPTTPPPAPVDPLRPGEKVAMATDATRADLWERVRKGFTMPDLDNELVRDREQWYAARPDYVARTTGRAGRYLFHIVEEIERRGMPTELALLPFVESAFNPQALSTAKASGMWQFIPSTGRDFLLTQNIFRDDRRDVLASTRAALDYLQRLHEQFGNWHLALAAYNWGEGSVQRAIDRNERAGLPTDYESLRMPDETRYYVPKLQAVKNLVARPADFGLVLPEVANHPYFLSVPIDRDIDVDVAARLAGVSLEEFRTLNPQFKKPVILAAGTPQVLLPYDNANDFVRRLGLHKGPLATWTAWVAPRTMRPTEVADEVGMTEAELREVNHIPFRVLVKAGSTLLVPRDDASQIDVSGDVADNATMAFTPEMRMVPRSTAQRLARLRAVNAAASRSRAAMAASARLAAAPAADRRAARGVAPVVAIVPIASAMRAAVPAGASGRPTKAGGSARIAVADARPAPRAAAPRANGIAKLAATPHRVRIALGGNR